MNVTKEQLVEKLDHLEKAYREWAELGDNFGELFGWDFIDGKLARTHDSLLTSLFRLILRAVRNMYRGVMVVDIRCWLGVKGNTTGVTERLESLLFD